MKQWILRIAYGAKQRKLGQRFLSFLLAAVLLSSGFVRLPVTANAQELDTPDASGTIERPDAEAVSAAAPTSIETGETDGEEADAAVPASLVSQEPNETPDPAETAQPEETPAPAETAQPEETPAPAETAQPVETPAPAETAQPVETPAPAETAQPVETPAPDDGSDPTADVEDYNDWTRFQFGAQLTGEWARDLVALAKSQLGYTESAKNFVITDGVKHGYTRYGAWYGDPYGAWDALFVSFCLHFSLIPETAMPRENDAARWAEGYLKSGALQTPDSGYEPKAGDLVFFCDPMDPARTANHMGIVTEVTNETVQTIEGGAIVRSVSYPRSDLSILGYVELPENPNYIPTETAADAEPKVPAVPVQEQSIRATLVSGSEVNAASVPAKAPKKGLRLQNAAPAARIEESVTLSGLLPVGASVSAEAVSVSIPGCTVLAAYDITIQDADGNEWQPTKAVTVEIGNAALEEGVLGVYHMENTSAQAEFIGNVGASAGSVSFAADSFSVYVIVKHEGGTDIVTPRVEFHYIDPNFDAAQSGGGTYVAGPYLFDNQAHTDGSNDGKQFWSQIVKNGETLSFVPTPADQNNQHFEGWYHVTCLEDLVSTNGKGGAYTYKWPNSPTRQIFDQAVSVAISGSTVTYTVNGTSYSGTADSSGCLHVYLAPLYVNYRFVNFYDWDDNMVARKLLVLDSNGEATISVSDVIAPNPDADHYFMGWSTEKYNKTVGAVQTQAPANTFTIYEDGYKVDAYITLQETDDGGTTKFNIYEGALSHAQLGSATPKIANYSPVDNNVNIYGEYEIAHWLRFVAGETGWGSLYVPADYLVGNAPATKLPTTSRSGYTFAGWWTGWQDAAGKIHYVQQVSGPADSEGKSTVSTQGGAVNLIVSDAAGALTVRDYDNNSVTTKARSTGTVSADGKLTMTDHSYLYARWTADRTANYTVTIWQQKVTDSVDSDYTPTQYAAWASAYKAQSGHEGDTDAQVQAAFAAAGHAVKVYDYVSSEVRSCSDTSVAVNPTNTDISKSFTGFHLANAAGGYTSYDANVYVDPQGTTVINVYYDRNDYTLTFQDYTYTQSNYGSYGLQNGVYVYLSWSGRNYYYLALGTTPVGASATVYNRNNDATTTPTYNTAYYGNTNRADPLTWTKYTGANRYTRNGSRATIKTIHALYGQDISGNFPIVGTNGFTYNHGERWDPQNGTTYSDVIVYINQMPGESITFNLNDAVRATKTLRFYVEALDADAAVATDVTRGGVRYKLLNTIPANVAFMTQDDYINMYGYTKAGADPDFDANGAIRNADSVSFYYLREPYSLTFNFNYPGGATYSGDHRAYTNDNSENLDDSATGIKYGSSLASYAATWTKDNIGSYTPDHYVFDGWFEDKSCTIPFDFNNPTGIQANKEIYAKWYPIWYLISLDPAGGTLAGADNQAESTYFWLQYGTTVSRYTSEREYIEADAAYQAAHPDETYYYYRSVSFQGFEHARWSSVRNVANLYYVDPNDAAAVDAEKDNEGIKPAFDRLAEYVKVSDYHGANDTFYRYLADNLQTYPAKTTAEYWDSFYVDTTKVYRKIQTGDPTYSLVGWYLPNGQPYDFASAVTEPVKLTAVWRQSGSYRLNYSSAMTELVSGTQVVSDLTSAAWDPGETGEAYTDRADAVIGTAPSDIRDSTEDNNVYVFEGWRVVNTEGKPLDESGAVLTSGTGTLYQPGDTYMIHAEQAINGVIYMEPYFQRVEDSARRPQTVGLTLDANAGQNGSLTYSATLPSWVHPGSVGFDSITSPMQLLFGDTQTNADVHLANYKSLFKQADNYFFLGFDQKNDPLTLDNGQYIPTYAADAVLGVDLTDPAEHKLYAIWEPMIYVTFVNTTSSDLTVDLSETDAGVITIVNLVTGEFDREAASATTITIPARKDGEDGKAKIVLPVAAAGSSVIKAAVTNQHWGYKLKVSGQFETTVPYGTVDPADLDNPGVLYGDTLKYEGTLRLGADGVVVTYTEEQLRRIMYDVNGGTWTNTSGITAPSGDVLAYQEFDQDYVVPSNKVKEPNKPTRSGLVFVGWTTNRDIAARTNFTATNPVTWGETTITPDAGSNVLAKVKSDYLWKFGTDPVTEPTVLYAVWSVPVTVTFDLIRSGSNIHTWNTATPTTTTQGNNVYVRASSSARTVTYTMALGDVVPKPEDPRWTGSDSGQFFRWIVNPDEPNTALTTYTAATRNPDEIPVTNQFDFTKPVTKATTLTTSWTTAQSFDVGITKKMNDAANDPFSSQYHDTRFTFRYRICTYSYNGSNTPVKSTVSEPAEWTTLALSEDDGEKTITLHYWAVGTTFYYETLEIYETDKQGFTLSVERESGSDTTFTSLVNDGEHDVYKVDLFTHNGSYGIREYNTSYGWRWYYSSGGNNYYRPSNAWRNNNYQPTSYTYGAVFTNKRDTTTLKITKEMEDAENPTADFTFGTAILDEGSAKTISPKTGEDSFTLTAANGGATVEKTITVPTYTSVTVTETGDTSRYTTAITDGTDSVMAKAFTASVEGTEITLAFTNSFYICKIGDTPYTTLREAVEAVPDSMVPTYIEMLVNYTMPETDSVTVPSGKNVVLMTADKSGQLPYRDAGTTATITRGFDGEAMFTVESGGSLRLGGQRSLILDGAKADKTGAFVELEGTGVNVAVNNATLQNAKTASAGSAIQANGGTVTIVNSSITGNEAGGEGGAVYGAGTVNVSGAAIVYDNLTGSEQRNIVVSAATTIQVNGTLDSAAKIGVYASDEAINGEGKQFGVYADSLTANLNVFYNDARNGADGNPLRGADGGAGMIVWPYCKVTDGQNFDMSFTDKPNVAISRDSSYTIQMTADAFGYLAFRNEDGTPATVPIGTTVLLMTKKSGQADYVFYYYKAAAGTSAVAITDFAKLGNSEDLTGGFTGQFIVDFSQTASGMPGSKLVTGMAASADGALANSGTVTLADQAGFSLSGDETANGLTVNTTVGYTASAGTATIWDDRSMALVVESSGSNVLPPDARLKVTVGGSATEYTQYAAGKFILPLGALSSYDVQIELVSDLFPKAETEYALSAKLMVANTPVAGSPNNGTQMASATLKFTSGTVSRPSVKITGEQSGQPGQKLTFTVENLNIPDAAVVTATVYKKTGNDWTSAQAFDAQTLKTADTAATGSWTVEFDQLEGDYNSYMLVVTVKIGATTLLEVPYYFLAVKGD